MDFICVPVEKIRAGIWENAFSGFSPIGTRYQPGMPALHLETGGNDGRPAFAIFIHDEPYASFLNLRLVAETYRNDLYLKL